MSQACRRLFFVEPDGRVRVIRRVRGGTHAPDLHQGGFRRRDDDVGLNSATWNNDSGVNTNFSQETGVTFRVRFAIENQGTADPVSQGYVLQFNLEGAGFVNVTGSTAVQISGSDQFTDNEAITSSQIAGSTGTFINGAGDDVGGGVPNAGMVIGAGTFTEFEWCLEIDPAQVSDGEQFSLRVIGGVVLDSYDATPTVTVVAGPLSVAVGQATEADSAQSVTGLKEKALSQPSETDVAQTVAQVTAVPVGQATETGAAFALAAAKRRTLGLVTETDAARTVMLPVMGPVWRETTPLLNAPCLEFAGGEKLTLWDNAGAATKPLSAMLAAGEKMILIPFRLASVGSTAVNANENDILIASDGDFWGVSVRNDGDGSYTLRHWNNDGGGLDVAEVDVELDRNYVLAAWHESGSLELELYDGAGLVDSGSIASGDTPDLTDDVMVGGSTSGAYLNGRVGEIRAYSAYDASQLSEDVAALVAKWIGEIVVSVGIVSEADSAQAVDRSKVRAIAQVSETDATLPVDPNPLRRLIGAVAESDAAQTFAAAKARALSQPVETDTARPIGQVATVSVGQTTETDASFALTSAKARAIGQTAETDTAQSFDVDPFRRLIAAASETGTAQAVDHAKAKTLGVVAETSLARTLQALQAYTVAGVLETDSAFAIAPAHVVSVEFASETDLGQALAHLKARGVGLVTETDLARTIDLDPLRRLIDPAAESDAAFAIVSLAPELVNPAAESDTAQGFGRLKTASVSPVTEADAALTLAASLKSRAIGLATETDLAVAIARLKLRALGLNAEADTAFSIAAAAAELVGQVGETDVARTLARLKTRSVAQTSETDLAQALTRLKVQSLGLVTEADVAQVLGRLKARELGLATEADLAGSVTSGGKVFVTGLALETDLAQLIRWDPKHRLIRQVAETGAVFSIAALKRYALGLTAESDAALAAVVRRIYELGEPAETNTAQPLARALTLGIVSETDLARAIAAARLYPLGLATEADLAETLATAKRVALGLAIELDQAIGLFFGAPSVPGLEWTAPASRLHYTAPGNRIHFAAPTNRIHYTAPDED